MKIVNRVTTKIRQAIADELEMAGFSYHGELNEPSFLIRIFDLKNLPVLRDDRFKNAYDEIYQHTVNNPWDYPDGWIYTDPRINLLHVEDGTYLKFLSETLHPKVRSDNGKIQQIIAIYNKHLAAVDLEIVKEKEEYGKAFYSFVDRSSASAHLGVKTMLIKKYLDTSYVYSKIDLMNRAINNDTDLAIGTAKELIETACKSILKQKGITPNPKWYLSDLLNETINQLDFKPEKADNPTLAANSIKKMLKGLTQTITAVAELRNAYGTGHGKHADFKGLDPKYARLVVGAATEIVTMFLSVNGESAELDVS